MGVEGAAGAFEGEGRDLVISADIRAAKSIVMVGGVVVLVLVGVLMVLRGEVPALAAGMPFVGGGRLSSWKGTVSKLGPWEGRMR